jgi:hypothetical protein
MMCDSGVSFLGAHSKNRKSSSKKLLSRNTTSAIEDAISRRIKTQLNFL